jgi:hypothetical protein
MLRLLKDATTAHGRSLPLALVFAVAFATYFLASALAQVVVFALEQHVGRESRSDFGALTFHVAGTRIDYASVLQHGLAIAVLGGALYAVWRLGADAFGTCPDCRSEIPRDATVCRYCTGDLSAEGPR